MSDQILKQQVESCSSGMNKCWLLISENTGCQKYLTIWFGSNEYSNEFLTAGQVVEIKSKKRAKKELNSK